MNIKKKIFALIVALIIMGTQMTNCVFSYEGLPSQIRIGLFFSSTAKPFVNLTSSSGFDIGYEKDGAYVNIFSLPGDEGLVVRKDGYFINSGATMSEFSPDGGEAAQPDRSGPFHIQFSGNFNSFEATREKLGFLKQKGMDAYPVFVNNIFTIWGGAYTTEASARAKMSQIQPLLASTACELSVPSSAAIQILKPDSNEICFIFDSASLYPFVKPISNGNEIIPIGINTASYRGGIEFKRFDGGNLTVINKLGLEEYLYGVLPKEMSGDWPLEALKAQAVSARTYALYNMNKYQKNGFNLTDTDASQVYGGFKSEKPACTKAVDETSGKVLTYEGKLAQTFFFSSSGGQTEDPKNVWGGTIPYLKGVEDPYEPTEKVGRGIWTVAMTPQEIGEKLKAKGYNLGEIQSVTALEYSEANRVLKLKIAGTTGEKIFEKDSARTALGLNSQCYTITGANPNYAVNGSNESVLLSSDPSLRVLGASGEKVINALTDGVQVIGAQGSKKYTIAAEGYVFDGRGWGHGVGLSQWGAYGMAQAGFTYDKILMHYYPGTELQ